MPTPFGLIHCKLDYLFIDAATGIEFFMKNKSSVFISKLEESFFSPAAIPR